ncbi:NAD(P)-dependent oxidoreductase [Gillisia sp. Hel_I_29]|uniref:NAD(P)-dependent oxidoreductase n=1 Tax=Gillisia sp. Hel_I_29 TaxID=1249975 RepID=UPI000556A4A2|nr:NAD(P)-dependent oxidoreductase [Gillisia sp. Hel_I_29]
MKIGFIGLGIMGSAMASNLLKSDHQLYVYNRTKDKADTLIEKGAIWKDSPAELAKDIDVLFTMLEDPNAVENLAIGTDGFVNEMKEGSIWIDSSTVNPSFTKKMAGIALKNNIRFLDAPVSGSKVPAEKGELLFLVGGEATDMEELNPLFDLMGQKAVHMGDHGKGSAMKIMINQLLGQSMLAFSESVSLGMALGLDKKMAMDVLLNTPVTAPILNVFRYRLDEENYEPNFPLKHLQKDLHLFTETAFELNQAVPLTNAAKEVYAQAKQKGQGDLDFSSIFKFINE